VIEEQSEIDHLHEALENPDFRRLRGVATPTMERKPGNVPRKPRRWRRALLVWGRRLTDAATMLRVQVVAHATGGRSALEIVDALGCVRSHVYRRAAKFVRGGRVALLDGRYRNGGRIADFERCIGALVRESPQDHGYPRPTWTRDLFILVAEKLTGGPRQPHAHGTRAASNRRPPRTA
jgi:hypothetical protein